MTPTERLYVGTPRASEMGLTPDPDQFAPTVAAIVEAIRPLLAGRHSAMQGAVLASLTGVWLAGHRPEVWSSLLNMHMESVRQLAHVEREALQ